MTGADLKIDRSDIEISVAIPCYNEEGNAEGIGHAVLEQLETLGVTFEIVFIDNASTDRTVDIIKRMCAADPRIRLIVNSRNFGQVRSPTHAIYRTRGRAVIGMCADFQDPPELIPLLVERWRSGAEIVLGVRESEKSTLMLRVWRGLGYRILGRIADHPIIRNATGFGLYSRRVVDLLASYREPEPFFRALLLETGLPVDLIRYSRPERRAGVSKNDFVALLDFSLTALSTSSKRMLRGPFFVAVALLLVAIGCAVAAVVAGSFGRSIAPTLCWLAFFELHFGVLFFFIGLIGDQLRLVSERTRHSPLVIEREQINIEPPVRQRDYA